MNQTPNLQRRLRIFTWHIHGTYLYYLTQAECDFILPVNADRSNGYGGRVGSFPWGSNVYEVPVSEVKNTHFDLILFQSRQHYEIDQHEIFSEAQRRLPKVYLEHDPPREHPTDTRHWVRDPQVTLVHCTQFNDLMWDSNGVPTVVIDHGVVDPGYRYTGSLDRALVIINNLPTRGRRLGLDVFEHVRQRVPVDLVGMGSEAIGGLGEVQHRDLPDFMAQYRVFFNPIRYTSLGLAIIESMMVGLPMVGLATTELVSVITPDFNGYISLNPNVLVERIRALLDNPVLAHKLGQNARAYALERFGIPRFAAEWESLFQRLCNQAACSPVVNITA